MRTIFIDQYGNPLDESLLPNYAAAPVRTFMIRSTQGEAVLVMQADPSQMMLTLSPAALTVVG